MAVTSLWLAAPFVLWDVARPLAMPLPFKQSPASIDPIAVLVLIWF